ncbi:MAG: MFS transporter [Pirellulales bacterium]
MPRPKVADGSSRPSQVRYGVLAAFCAITAIAYIQRNSISTAESTIRTDLALTKAQCGQIISAFALTYAIFQLPAAWLARRIGPRKALVGMAVAWSLCSAAIGLPGGYYTAIASRLALGATQAGIFIAMTMSVAVWFPAKARATASGALASFMSLGGAMGAALTGLLLRPIAEGTAALPPAAGWWQMDWRLIFALYAIPGLIWAAWFFGWFRDQPADHPAVNPEELAVIGTPHASAGAARGERTPWGLILSSRAMWWIAGQQFFRAAGYAFFTSWFATFLQESRHVSISKSGIMNSLPLLAVVASGFVGGWASDKLTLLTNSQRIGRQAFAAGSLLLSAGLIVLAYFVADVWLAVLVISLGSFCASLAGPSAYAVTIDMGGKHVGTVFGLMNMSGNFAAAGIPLLLPLLQKMTGSWDFVLFLFAGIYLAGAICWLMFDSRQTIGEKRPAL